jgi:hypothetical protein
MPVTFTGNTVGRFVPENVAADLVYMIKVPVPSFNVILPVFAP